jgi:hypothetical protein
VKCINGLCYTIVEKKTSVKDGHMEFLCAEKVEGAVKGVPFIRVSKENAFLYVAKKEDIHGSDPLFIWECPCRLEGDISGPME